MAIQDKILRLTRQLYPTGRAFKMVAGGFFDKLHVSLSLSETRAYNDAVSTLSDIIPDNAEFGTDDATDWERRLGLITNTAVSLSDRSAAILRKMNQPGPILPHENWRYVQKQLQAAGFNVYIYENRFSDGMGGYVTQDPLVFSGGLGGDQNQLGDFQLGDAELGSQFGAKVVNSLDPNVDLFFDIGSNLRFTFFVGGSTSGSFANVDVNRETEFRQLILRIKPAQTVAFLLINFI